MKFFFNYLSIVLLFMALGLSYNIEGHSVQVAYCANCNGDLRIWVEHWHSTENPSSTTMTLNCTVNGVTTTRTGVPNFSIQNTPFAALPGCSSPLTIFGSCPGKANTYNDWVAYDFIGMPVGVPITITIISGNTAFTKDGCSMYPASTGVIIIPPPPSVSNVTGCTGGTGSVIGPFNFAQDNTWTNDNTAIGLAASGTGNIPAFTATNNPTTEVANIVISNTCGNSTFSITVNPTPPPNAGTYAGADITTCPGNILGNLGTAPVSGYTYSWSPVTGLNSATVSDPTVALNIPGTTTYIKTITALNCSSTDTVVVIVNPLPTATIAATTAVCKDAPPPNITFTGATGTAPYTFTYTINGGANQTVTSSGNSATMPASTSAAGTFIYALVGVQDASSTTCSQAQSGSATITVNPLPTATIVGTTSVCKNAGGPNITFTGANATAPYTFTYTINGGANQTVTSSGNSAIVPAPTTTAGIFIYNLISVQDASSTTCSQLQSGSTTVTVNPLPTATITGTTTVCKNDPAPTITFTGAAGTAPYTFTYTINSGPNLTVSTTNGNSVAVPVPASIAGVYTYAIVSVRDASSTACSQTQNGSATVTVNPLPIATIAGTTAVCKNANAPNITFTGYVGTAPYTFTYTINGGTNQTVSTTNGNSVTVPAPTVTVGSFIYALVSVQDASSTNCSQLQSGSAAVTVNPLPTATIAGTTAVCKNDTAPDITFTGVGSTAPYTFTYTINSGTNQTVSTISGNTVTVAVPTGIAGTFVYALVSVEDASITACSQAQSGSAAVIVNPLPVADFDFADVCLHEAVNFSDSSTVASGTVTAWSWDLGDGSPPIPLTGFQTLSGVIYAAPGNYNVTLIVTTNSGCKDTVAKSAVVHPLPYAQYHTANVCEGSIVYFNDSSTIPATDTIQYWTWDLGDGSLPITLTGFQILSGILYAAPGSYPVQLLVVSYFGCSDSITKISVVNPNPVVNFTASDTAGCSPKCINFIDLSSILTGSYAVQWDFGDGNNSSEPDHCYTNDSVFSPLSFTPTLTVTSDSGCVKTKSKNNYIAVYPVPNAGFMAQPEVTTIMEPIISTTNLSSGANFGNWDFGNQDTSSAFHPLPHTYADTGTYTITLITSTLYGCLDTAYQTVMIEPDFAFYIPNAFSPNNNDGINETFSGKGIFVSQYEMMIYDRWGNLIFFSENINKGWDGKANYGDKPAQADVYVYSIKLTDIKGNKHSYKGKVTLVR